MRAASRQVRVRSRCLRSRELFTGCRSAGSDGARWFPPQGACDICGCGICGVRRAACGRTGDGSTLPHHPAWGVAIRVGTYGEVY